MRSSRRRVNGVSVFYGVTGGRDAALVTVATCAVLQAWKPGGQSRRVTGSLKEPKEG
ncbi:MAG: hypothetical protein JRN35_02890 [Nitrososphaerota archaeon]|nr:hypothetical protein [Nitrososphaerota archaeon]MDG7030202.1 hypothetical protein [Nitrososphaerota archaeon]